MTMATAPTSAAPASRHLVIIGFVCATIFSGFVTFGVGVYSADHQARLADRTAQANRFGDAAEAFDSLVVTFVAETNKGGASEATRKAIKTNLMSQRGALENASGLLSPSDQSLANDYMKALVDVDAGLKTSSGPLHSREFMQAAAHIAEQRPRLIKALRHG